MNELRIVKTGLNNAFFNMAVDEALLNLSNKPILRFYKWNPSAVSIGYFQDINDINIEFCKKNNIDVVRRLTGGKALLHDKELTYSFIIDEKEMPESVIESYKIISEPILRALQDLEFNAKFKSEQVKKSKTPVCLSNPSWYEITIDGKKVVAAAQKRMNGKILQHGSILLDIDYEKQCKIFNGFNEKLIEKTKQTITSLNQHNEINEEKLIAQIIESFNLKNKESQLTDEEKELTKQLEKKYKSKEWVFKNQQKTI